MSSDKIFGRAVKWAYVMNFGQQGLTALFTFALAAILGPRDFGTVAMAMVYIQFIQIFLEQGLVATLIQRKDLNSEHLDSVFWMGLLLSVILMIVSISFSRWWAVANHLPQLAFVICALSLILPIEALDMVQRAILQREMDFKNLSVRTNIAVILGGIVGVLMAFRGAGVWSLVGQRLIQETIALGLLWKLSRWRPRLRFNVSRLKELSGISSSNLVGRIGVFVGGYGDTLLMGMFFGPIAVGLYQLAARLMSTVLTIATGSIQAVSLPEFSRLQDDHSRLRNSMLACIRLTSISTVPAMIGLAAVSDPLMRTLGTKWTQSADAIKILCLVGIVMSFQYLIGPLLQAVSKPHYAAAMVWGHGLFNACALMMSATVLQHASTGQQILGMAFVRLSVAILIFVPIVICALNGICHISFSQFIRPVVPSFVAAFSAAAVVIALQSTRLSTSSPVVVLVIEVCAGALAGTMVLLALDAGLRDMLHGRRWPRPAEIGPTT